MLEVPSTMWEPPAGYRRAAPDLAIFEQGGVLIYFLLLLGGKDDTSKTVIVTLLNLWGEC